MTVKEMERVCDRIARSYLEPLPPSLVHISARCEDMRVLMVVDEIGPGYLIRLTRVPPPGHPGSPLSEWTEIPDGTFCCEDNYPSGLDPDHPLGVLQPIFARMVLLGFSRGV